MAKIEWLGELVPRAEDEVKNATIDKIAQRRSVMQWLHEKANVPKHINEAFSSNYKGQMELLRGVDDAIRNSAGSLDNDIREAKKALRQRKYLDTIHFIGNINDDIKKMIKDGSELKNSLGKDLESFYTAHEHADTARDYFGKQAGIMDFFQGSGRRAAGRVFENAYRNMLEERKLAMRKLVGETEYLVAFTLDALKDLGTLRAQGNIGDYVAKLDKIAAKRAGFEKSFRGVYDKYIVPMIAKIREAEEANKKVTDETKSETKSAPVDPRPSSPDRRPEMTAEQYADAVRNRREPSVIINDRPTPREIPDLEVSLPASSPAEPIAPQEEVVPTSYDIPPMVETAPEEHVPFSNPEKYDIPENVLTGYKGSIPHNLPMARKTFGPGGQYASAGELVSELIKSGMSRNDIKKTILAYSEDFDDAGMGDESLRMIAIAETIDTWCLDA